MMSLFAQVFQIAAGTVSTQRGIMENDQRARSVQTVITKDLSNRTFRYVWPWAPRFAGNLTPVNSEESDMLGYFYISENDPFDDTDDVLQFTGKITTTVNSLADTDSYTGRALQVGNSQNQPDYDDGDLGNLAALSSTAEISLFMRRGTTGRPGALYRRVMLVRQPADSTAEIEPHEDGNTTNTLFDSTSGATTRYTPSATSTFWKDFDFSARPISARTFNQTMPPPFIDGVRFNTLTDLQLPTSRFGFEFADGTVNAGKPREFLSSVFFGRYTMEETSNVAFQYPFVATPSPMNQATAGLTVNATTGVVDPLQHNSTNGSRRGEDLLLANVVSFDVKVWDDFANGGLGAFVDIGGPGSVLYSANPAVSGNVDRRLNVNFGPGAANDNNVFDTWGPLVWLASVPTDPAENPPFLPRRYVAGATASAFELPRFTAGTTAGAVLPAEVSPGLSSIPGDPVFFVRSGSSAGTNNAAGASIPITAPIVYGTPINDGVVEWTPVDNRRPLRLIQITVRFLDPTSQQLRTVTMQCDLTP
nr:hypothetical protein [Planctopirus ephydatiae]